MNEVQQKKMAIISLNQNAFEHRIRITQACVCIEMQWNVCEGERKNLEMHFNHLPVDCVCAYVCLFVCSIINSSLQLLRMQQKILVFGKYFSVIIGKMQRAPEKNSS